MVWMDSAQFVWFISKEPVSVFEKKVKKKKQIPGE